METKWLDSYLLDNPGAVRDYKEEWGWDRYLVGGKMFAASFIKDGVHCVSLKCEPDFGDFLRRTYPSVTPGYYMNKTHWNTVDLDAELPEEVLKEMCGRSYALVFAELSKKVRAEILSGGASQCSGC